MCVQTQTVSHFWEVFWDSVPPGLPNLFLRRCYRLTPDTSWSEQGRLVLKRCIPTRLFRPGGNRECNDAAVNVTFLPYHQLQAFHRASQSIIRENLQKHETQQPSQLPLSTTTTDYHSSRYSEKVYSPQHTYTHTPV